MKKPGQNVHVLNGYIAALNFELKHHTDTMLKIKNGSAPKSEKDLMMGMCNDNMARLIVRIEEMEKSRATFAK